MSGRFDYRFEMQSIYQGMQRDLQKEVGQTVPWYVLDRTSTQPDDTYDTGSVAVGRVWFAPRPLPCLSVVAREGQDMANQKGLYVINTLTVVVGAEALRRAGLGDVVDDPEQHTVDRIVYQDRVYKPTEVRARGVLTSPYAVVGVDAVQVMPDELVNDRQFARFAQAG